MSIVIATAGQAPYFDRVVEAVALQTYRSCEVIVVDNNRIQQVQNGIGFGLLHPVNVVHERVPGLSRARNRGISVARGDVIAFFDDDAVPDEDWVMKLVEGIARYGSSAAGGTVELALPKRIPYWFCDEIRQLLSALNYERIDIPVISLSQYIVGANMCITRSALSTYGAFNPMFGRVGRMLRSSEELEFCRRLQRVGERVSFIANARVRHLLHGGSELNGVKGARPAQDAQDGGAKVCEPETAAAVMQTVSQADDLRDGDTVDEVQRGEVEDDVGVASALVLDLLFQRGAIKAAEAAGKRKDGGAGKLDGRAFKERNTLALAGEGKHLPGERKEQAEAVGDVASEQAAGFAAGAIEPFDAEALIFFWRARHDAGNHIK